MIGQLLDGRYRIVRNLSAGGFGQTYVAEDTKIPGNPSCVVKHLKPANSDPGYLQIASRLFTGEAETLAKLGNHDRIPRLLAYFTENQEFYLVEEFVAGDTLGKQLQSGQRWSENQVIQFLDDILTTLEFVHSHGMIHRDIKPDNIIRREGDFKFALIDFGAIKQIQNQLATQMEPLSPTVAVGTPGYMPTEQAQGRPRPSSDIYALGIIAVQALTGVSPRELREDPQTGEINWQHLTSVSAGLASVVTKMIAYQFKDRYKTATEVKQALNQVSQQAISSTSNVPLAEVAFPPTQVNPPYTPTIETAETVATPPRSSPQPLTQPITQPHNSPTYQPPQPSHQPQLLAQFSPNSPNSQSDSQSSIAPPSKNGVTIALWIVGLIAAVGIGALLATKGFPALLGKSPTPQSTLPPPQPTNTSSSSPPPTTQPTTDPTPTPTPTSSTDTTQVTALNEVDAVERVRQLVEGKQKLFAPPFDRDLLAQLAVGDEYEKRKGSIDWLQKNNAYYNYGQFEIKTLGQFSLQGDQATVEVEISENPTLYVNGQIDQSQSIPSRGRYRCTLQFDRQTWKIATLTKI
jgi:serine/threonine protein kinase